MAKGAVYRNSQFQFHDGAVGEKRFVVINEPHLDEPYLVVRTTSNLRNRTYNKGCNSDKGIFFIAKGTDQPLPLDTLVQLFEIYEFSKQELLTASLQDKTLDFIGDLSSLTVAQIINCIRKLKDDISEKHFKMITR